MAVSEHQCFGSREVSDSLVVVELLVSLLGWLVANGSNGGDDQDSEEDPELPGGGLEGSVVDLLLGWPVLGPEEESKSIGEKVSSNEWGGHIDDWDSEFEGSEESNSSRDDNKSPPPPLWSPSGWDSNDVVEEDSSASSTEGSKSGNGNPDLSSDDGSGNSSTNDGEDEGHPPASGAHGPSKLNTEWEKKIPSTKSSNGRDGIWEPLESLSWNERPNDHKNDSKYPRVLLEEVSGGVHGLVSEILEVVDSVVDGAVSSTHLSFRFFNTYI